MRNKAGAQQYKKIHNAVRAAFNKWDLYDLIAMGAPLDEYEPEVIRVLPRVSKEHSVVQIAQSISDVFSYMFEDSAAFGVERCMGVAAEVKNILQKMITHYNR